MLTKTARPTASRRGRSISSDRWKLLNDEDVAGVLEAMGKEFCTFDADKKEELKRAINDELMQRQAEQKTITPHALIATLRRIENAAAELLAALQSHPHIDDLAYAEDFLSGHPRSPASLEALRSHFPGDREIMVVILRHLGFIVPIDDAKARLARDRRGVALLRRRAAFAAKRHRKALGTKKRQGDEIRYTLITRLAGIYFSIFSVTPTATRSGPWVSFLAAVLSRCEGVELSAEQAYQVWRVTRTWAHKQLNLLVDACESTTKAAS